MAITDCQALDRARLDPISLRAMEGSSVWQGHWVVTAYRLGDEMVAPDTRSQVDLTIQGTQLSGSMGVNRLSGAFTGEFPLRPLAMTRMAGPPELMHQEDTLVGYLQSADSVEDDDTGMTLTRGGLILMKLERSGTGENTPTSQHCG